MGSRIQNHRNGIVTLAPHLLPERRPLAELPTHRHEGEFEWFFCAEGGGVQAVGNWREPMRPGQLLLIPPGEPHVFAADPAGGCHCEVLMMPYGFPEGEGAAAAEARLLLGFWRKRVLERGFIAGLPEEAARRGGELMRRIRRWSERPAFGGTLRTHAALLELLALAFELDDPPRYRLGTATPEHDAAIETVLYFLDNHFSRRISVAEAAQLAGMSRSVFHRRFTRETGMSFCVYLNRLRLRAAETLIADGASAENAAARCGFFSRSNFFDQRRRYGEECGKG